MNFETAISLFEASENTCMIFKDGETLRTFEDRGIKPLVITLMNEPEILEGTTITDRIIGRAAALLCVEGKAQKVYGHIMSEGAKKVLEDAGIETAFETLVPIIRNRDNTDTCPMEKKVAHTENSHEAYTIFSTFLREKMAEAEAQK